MPLISSEGARCRRCGEWREQADFYKRGPNTENRTPHCRFCATVMAREQLARRVGRPVLPKPHDRDRTEKLCKDCSQLLPIDSFPLKNATTGARRERCQPCHNANTLAWKHQNAERRKATGAAYYRAHAAEVAEYQRKYREAHPEKYHAIHSGWKARNKDAVNASTHKRRAKLAGNGGAYTPAEWQALKARYDHRCLMCGRQEPEVKLTVDHIVPVSEGGPSTIDNIQPLCKSCNSKKHRGIVDLRERQPVKP